MSHSRLGLSEQSSDLLKDLNSEFLTQHEKTGLGSLVDIENVIIFKGGELFLYGKEDKQTEFSLTAKAPTEGKKNAAYTHIKMISHIPLLIFEILDDKSMTEATKLEKLELLKNKLIKINQEIKPTSPENKAQKVILENSIKLIASPKIDKLRRSQYVADINTSLQFNKQFVTKLQLKSINEILKSWIKDKLLNPHKSRALIVATHGPRDGLIEMQLFLDLYSKLGFEHPKDNLVYYIEQLPGQIKSLSNSELIEKFLATSERNKELGKIFAENQRMLFRDVLADEAPQVLTRFSFMAIVSKSSEETTLKGKCPFGFLPPS